MRQAPCFCQIWLRETLTPGSDFTCPPVIAPQRCMKSLTPRLPKLNICPSKSCPRTYISASFAAKTSLHKTGGTFAVQMWSWHLFGMCCGLGRYVWYHPTLPGPSKGAPLGAQWLPAQLVELPREIGRPHEELPQCSPSVWHGSTPTRHAGMVLGMVELDCLEPFNHSESVGFHFCRASSI